MLLDHAEILVYYVILPVPVTVVSEPTERRRVGINAWRKVIPVWWAADVIVTVMESVVDAVAKVIPVSPANSHFVVMRQIVHPVAVVVMTVVVEAARILIRDRSALVRWNPWWSLRVSETGFRPRSWFISRPVSRRSIVSRSV